MLTSCNFCDKIWLSFTKQGEYVLKKQILGEKYKIIPENPPNGGILFVDHSPLLHSGHLGHALVEYEPSKIIAFYPDCSDVNPVLPDFNGHS